jgi:hypothetical protein
MPEPEITYDVFISHAAADRAAADKLAQAFRNASISPFHHLIVEPSDDISDVLWEALAESTAVVAIISPNAISENLAVEVGAAKAWNKPVYLYLNGPASTPIPPVFASFEVFSQNRVDDLISAISNARLPLSSEDLDSLIELYAHNSYSVDKLATSPRALDKLTREFNKRRRSHLSGESLLRELIRLRKLGKLPRTQRAPVRKGA